MHDGKVLYHGTSSTPMTILDKVILYLGMVEKKKESWASSPATSLLALPYMPYNTGKV